MNKLIELEGKMTDHELNDLSKSMLKTLKKVNNPYSSIITYEYSEGLQSTYRANANSLKALVRRGLIEKVLKRDAVIEHIYYWKITDKGRQVLEEMEKSK